MEHQAYKQIEKKIDRILEQWNDIEQAISDPTLPSNPNEYKRVMQTHTHLYSLKETRDDFLALCQSLDDAKELSTSEDSEMSSLAHDEISILEPKIETRFNALKLLAIPIDPLDSKNIIMEIRAGTGGDEAALFVADMFRMYTRYAETKKWKIEIIESNETGIGGYKEIIFSIGGHSYGTLKFESGVHRVQRIPTTESGGRIHTSAVTVAVLPEIEETEIEIKNEEIRIDVFRSSGPGGQSVNTTDSAVRITHLPTGLVVTCQDEKSQHKNRAKALRVLRARLTAAQEEKKQKERAEERKTQIGSGDRSERIRTYNYPQNRVSDHRIQLTLYHLDRILEGDLEEVLSAVRIGLNE